MILMGLVRARKGRRFGSGLWSRGGMSVMSWVGEFHCAMSCPQVKDDKSEK